LVRPKPGLKQPSGFAKSNSRPLRGCAPWRARGASGDLEKIQATVLAINSTDDEINPPETGFMTRAMKRLKNGRLFLILTSDETSGHLTTGHAKFYNQVLQRLLDAVPRRPM